MKSSNKDFNLLLEIMDDFIRSDRVRCIHCCCIITNPECGAICDTCYDPMNYLDGDDE